MLFPIAASEAEKAFQAAKAGRASEAADTAGNPAVTHAQLDIAAGGGIFKDHNLAVVVRGNERPAGQHVALVVLLGEGDAVLLGALLCGGVSALVKARSTGHGIRWAEGFDELVARSFIHLELPPLNLSDTAVQALASAAALVLLFGWLAVRRSSGPLSGQLVVAASVPLAAALLVLLLEGLLTPTGYLLLFAIAAAVELWRFGRDDNGAATLRRTWFTVAAAFLVYHAVIVPLGMKPGYYSPWYQAPAHVFWILGIGVLMSSSRRTIPWRWRCAVSPCSTASRTPRRNYTSSTARPANWQVF